MIIIISCAVVFGVTLISYLLYKIRRWQRLQDRLNYISVHFHHISKEYMLPLSPNKECIKKHLDLIQRSDEELYVEENKIITRKLLTLRNKYPQGYDSFIKKYPSLSNSELIKKKNEIVKEDNQIREHARKVEIERKKQQINNNVKKLINATTIGDVDKAKETIKILDREIIGNSDENLNKAINDAKDRFDSQYKAGFVDAFDLSYVDYDCPLAFVQGNDWQYVTTKFPTKGTVVFSFRRNKVWRRGFMEERFQSELSKKLGKYKLQIVGDCGILPKDDTLPYEPDIAVIDLEKPSIRIDIEIDEPYAAITNKPTHYVGCGDEVRDLRLNNLGWIVVRFTEYQVFAEMDECIAYIAQLINKLNPTKILPNVLLKSTLPTKQKRWTEIESKLLAIDKYRQRYLRHEFGHTDEVPLEKKDIKQTEKEKKCSALVKPIIFPINNTNLVREGDDIFMERNNRIQFYPQEHIYLYAGKEELTPVSNIVSSLFNPFDSDYWSKYKANQRNIPQGQVLEEYDEKGDMAREIGTFMHLQIQNYYVGKPYQLSYHYNYDGTYVKTDVDVSLKCEFSQFKSFLLAHQFKPYRTEWAIYDEDIKIAGTIDMLHCRDGLFDIYDWKRSNKVLDSLGNPIVHNSFGQTGKDKYRNIDDTPYWHYCLQQNLYRYILESKYKIKVGKMYLIIFSELQNDYKKLEVPYMDEAISLIIGDCKKGIMKGI